MRASLVRMICGLIVSVSLAATSFGAEAEDAPESPARVDEVPAPEDVPTADATTGADATDDPAGDAAAEEPGAAEEEAGVGEPTTADDAVTPPTDVAADPADAAADPTDVPAEVTEPTDASTEEGVEPSSAKPPPDDMALEAPPEPTAQRSVYEYIEDVTITGPEGVTRVLCNCIIVLTSAGDTVTLELRPTTTRSKSRPEDPAPGMVGFRPASGTPAAWALQPSRLTFRFVPDEDRAVTIAEVPTSDADAVCAVLAQAPGDNDLRSDSQSEYRVHLHRNGKPFALRGEQHNGELVVDWQLSGAGAFVVSSRGWQLPMRFVIPKQEYDPAANATIEAEAEMVYASVRAGPEDETKLVVTAEATRDGKTFTYLRKCELRPVTLPADEPVEEWKTPSLVNGYGGPTAAWARTSTLAALGVQRLAGVRHAGMALWFGQLCLDSTAEYNSTRNVDPSARTARKMISELGAIGSAPVAPASLSSPNDGAGSRLRCAVAWNYASTGTEMDSDRDASVGLMTEVALGMKWNRGRNWRFGAGLEAFIVDYNTDDPRGFWEWMNLGGRVEYANTRVTVGATASVVYMTYVLDSSSRSATADLQAYGGGIDLEVMLTKSLGAGLRGYYAGDQDMYVQYHNYFLSWHVRPRVELDFRYTGYDMIDTEAIGGEVKASGRNGIGFGLVAKW